MRGGGTEQRRQVLDQAVEVADDFVIRDHLVAEARECERVHVTLAAKALLDEGLSECDRLGSLRQLLDTQLLLPNRGRLLADLGRQVLMCLVQSVSFKKGHFGFLSHVVDEAARRCYCEVEPFDLPVKVFLL